MNPEAIKAAALAWERARALQKAGRYAEAEPQFRAALKAMPKSAALLADYARLAEQVGDWRAAATLWQQVAAADPARDVGDHVGLALLQLNRNAEALPWLERYDAHHPDGADSSINLANCYSRLNRDADGIRILQRTVDRRPELLAAWEALVTLLVNEAEETAAEAALGKARARFPGDAELRYLQMDHCLKARRYGEGFDLFDARWQTRFFGGRMQLPQQRRWDGQPFSGRLLVRAEQGIGDELLYSSLFTDLAQRQPGSLVECEQRLLPLFRRSFPGLDFIARVPESGAPATADFDRDIMAGDLCRLFRRDAADFPAGAGWLQPDTTRVAELAASYQHAHGRQLRVGLSWRSANPGNGAAKSLRLADLLPILRLPGITFFNLQYGDTRAETAALASEHGITLVEDPRVDATRDLDGLAAQLSALDLLVSTSNSTVHLAGALGRPVLLMLHRDRGLSWYWAYAGERVPWYPGTRLVRCTQRGDWAPVFAEVAETLRKWPGAGL